MKSLLEAVPFVDGGECGSLVHYAFILIFVGSAFAAFLYLWKSNRLDMDEEPKYTMMDEEEKKDEPKRRRKPPR
jgi:hypothetical protein